MDEAVAVSAGDDWVLSADGVPDDGGGLAAFGDRGEDNDSNTPSAFEAASLAGKILRE